jgi:hypothetical protein
MKFDILTMVYNWHDLFDVDYTKFDHRFGLQKG